MNIDRAIADAETLFEQTAQARADAEAAEARAKHTLSAMVVHYRGEGKATGEAEHMARASKPYTDAMETWITANALWRTLDARAEVKRLKFEAWRTVAATERAKMNLR